MPVSVLFAYGLFSDFSIWEYARCNKFRISDSIMWSIDEHWDKISMKLQWKYILLRKESKVTVELHLSRLIETAGHPDMQNIRIIRSFFENTLHRHFVVRLLLFTVFTCVISKVLHTVRFFFKNEFILQNTFTGLQCNLHCASSQRSNVWTSLVFLSGRLRCWCVWLLRSPH
jgi:hypothetical protein